MADPVYRLFIDEVGHASMKSTWHPSERYLSLTGVIMSLHQERNVLAPALAELKFKTFGNTDVVLHRGEIARKCGAFAGLKDPVLDVQFNAGLLELVEHTSYRVITVVIDKLEHTRRYQVWRAYPYHYCLLAMLERYVMWLGKAQARGDVMVESRGKKENKMLSESYGRLYERGTDYVSPRMFQSWLSTKELKIREKTANIAGLQLADLIANASMRHMICERQNEPLTAEFARKVVAILRKNKYRRSASGEVSGIGTKWLP